MPSAEAFDEKHTLTLGGKNAAGRGREVSQGEIIGGSYRLKELLGRGGMGYVFRAEHTMIGRDYALKLLAPDMLDAESRLRFEREGRAIANLDHVNIVKVYNMGIDGGDCPYYVMDLLDGIGLADCIKKNQPIEYVDCLDIFHQIAAGLAYAHGKGIVHRDVKPSNIVLLQGQRGKALVKLVDFGIAKMLAKSSINAQSLTTAGEIFGTPYYMSPEQCLGGEIDARSDIYSLGCALYEALCGEPPFLGQSVLETMIMHQEKVPPSAVAAQGGRVLPPSVDGLIARMMAKRPSDRYQSMQQVMHDIERLRQGKQIGRATAGGAAAESGGDPGGEGGDGGNVGPPYERVDRTEGKAAVRKQQSDTVGHENRIGNGLPGKTRSLAALTASLLIVGGGALGWYYFGRHDAAAPPKSKIGSDTPAQATPTPGAALSSGRGFERLVAVDELPESMADRVAPRVKVEEIEKARTVFKEWGPIRSHRVNIDGKVMRQFDFPPISIGRINVPRQPGIQAQGRVTVPADENVELKIKASETAGFFVPQIYSRIGPNEFHKVSISDLGDSGGDTDLLPDRANGNLPVDILKIMAGWAEVRSLALNGLPIEGALLGAVAEIKKLTHLEFHKCAVSSVDSGKQHCFDRITDFQLDRVQGADILLACFSARSKVEKLKLDGTKVSPETLKKLSVCPMLDGMEFVKNSALSDELIQAVASMPHMRRLHFAGMQISRKQMQLLSDAPQIRHVFVDNGAYSQDEIRNLSPLPPRVTWGNDY